jgi:hypothetical protein
VEETGLLCNKTPTTAAILRPEIKDILWKMISLFSEFEEL